MIRKNKHSLIIVSVVLALCVFGVIMIYSASNYSANIRYGDKFYFVKKQLFGFVIGLFLMYFMYKTNYHKILNSYKSILIISVVLLILVFIPGFGTESYGAKRWINFFGISLQSSEIAKFAFVVFASKYMADNYKKFGTIRGIAPVILVGGIICLLILLEPNLSVTLCVGACMLLMLICGGIKLKHFIMLIVPAFLMLPILIFMEPYRIKRLMAFINPWANPKGEGFQLIQSLFSLGAGGLFGCGLFNSKQKYLFLPFAESDFIFSIIGEELGFVGCAILIMAYLTIIIQGIKIALNASDRAGCYLAFGIIIVIAMQLIINIAVVTGSIPPTGIPLPFISAGGTSLMVFLGAIGVLCNINKNSHNI